MTKRKAVSMRSSPGGWGEYADLTDAQRSEIKTCLSCQLDDCKGIDSPECPLHDPAAAEVVRFCRGVQRETDRAVRAAMSDKVSYGT